MARLLSINSYHYRRGGADAVYLDHAALFAEAGWDTRYFAMAHPDNLPSGPEATFTPVVDMEFARTPAQKAATAARSIYNAQARHDLRRLLARERFDVAHLHGIYHHLTPAILPELSRAGIPAVLTAHDLKLACPAYKMMNQNGICEACRKGGYWRAAVGRCIKGQFGPSAAVAAEAYLHRALGSYRRHLSMVVAPSRFYRDKLVEWGWPRERIRYIPNFTDAPAARSGAGYGGNILYFGRLSPEKGVATLIRAAALADVAVDIAGDGPERAALEALARETRAKAQFLGALSGEGLWDRVRRARTVVLPSEWYENAPLSLLEAMKLERPVIGADIGGIPELVPTGNDRTGWLFPSQDARHLAQLLRVSTDLPEAALFRLGCNGRAFVERQFTKELYLERMSGLYKELIAAQSTHTF